MDNLLRMGMYIAVAGLAVGTFWLAAEENTSGAVVTAGLAVALSIFVFLTRFKRFQGFGIKGELWDQEMERASELRQDLKELSERFAEIAIMQLGPGSRWGGIPEKDKRKLIDRTIRTLRDGGASSSDIYGIMRPWHKVTMRDLANPITNRICEAVSQATHGVDAEIAALGSPIPGEREDEHRVLLEKKRARDDTAATLNTMIYRDDFEDIPGLLRDHIDQNAWLDATIRQTINTDCEEEFRDIDQYATEQTVRRPEVLKQ